MARVIDGEAVAAPIRDRLRECVATLADAGVRPTLAVVSTTDDPSDRRYVDLKLAACAAVGIDATHHAVDPGAPAADLDATIDDLNDDPVVHAVFVQLPLPGTVPLMRVRERVDPRKDVDCLHPENLGRLAAGDPHFEPATPRAILELLASADVETAGADVVLVGRSDVVGKPLANRLLWKRSLADAGQRGPADGDGPLGTDATVTVCHSKTRDLAAHTRRADVVVSAANVPHLVDGSMLSEGVVVIDVGVNRVEAADGPGEQVVGDVAFESASEKASAITPVPGGVGPVTVAMLLRNVVQAASEQASVPVDLP